MVGIATAIVMRRFDMRFEPADVAGPAAFLIVPFWDITCFTVFFWLAVKWRKKPELHRRLMLIATCALTAAAWGRMPNQTFAFVWFYSGVDALKMCIRDRPRRADECSGVHAAGAGECGGRVAGINPARQRTADSG